MAYRDIPEPNPRAVEMAWLLGRLNGMAKELPVEFLSLALSLIPEIESDAQGLVDYIERARAMKDEFDPERIARLKEDLDSEQAVIVLRQERARRNH
jgi:hypothetical protein